MKLAHLIRTVTPAALLCVALTGCLNLKPVTDPTRYFLLSASAPPGQASPAPSDQGVLGIEPVTIPSYLMRPWIVTRTSDTEIRYSEYDKWSEPLENGIQRVLAEDLASRWGPDRIRLNAWKPKTVDVTLSLVVQRFEVTEKGEAVLEAQWQISGARSAVGHRIIRESGPPPATDPAGAVATLSKTINELSGFIVMDLKQ